MAKEGRDETSVEEFVDCLGEERGEGERGGDGRRGAGRGRKGREGKGRRSSGCGPRWLVGACCGFCVGDPARVALSPSPKSECRDCSYFT